MKINRHFTRADQNVFDSVEWSRRTSRITNLDGSVVFEMKDAEIPSFWSQLATDIMVSKYFRKAGVPQVDPASGKPQLDEQGQAVTGPETSARQVIHRLAGCWRHWGETHGYFDTPGDAQAFYDELCYMLLQQMAAPNSPQWFNTGLHWAYGINGPAQGHWYTDSVTGETRLSEDSYTHPQPHACFIQACEDDLVNEGGIMDLWVREARLFKYGSGTGTNFSSLRGENDRLSGGGRSSGLMSFLKIGDRAAGAIKSGGTTRRAAKMVCLDLDHPDIDAFVNWKVREEIKVAALVEGMKHLSQTQKKTAERLGLQLDYDFNGEAYATVSGQNSNNSVRIPNAFFHTLDEDGDWQLIRRTDGKIARTLPARELWGQIGYAAWRCADPGLQYDTTINEWHTCPESGRINASNPCSEYMFLDNTACNLASLNLLRFYDPQSRRFDIEAFEHAVNLWTLVLEISVLMAQFPSREIARLSFDFRTLGLGFANLGAMLMQAGIPYDSERGRSIGGCITAILTGRSYATSAEMAGELGAFAGYETNREHMLRVIRNHRRAAYGVCRESAMAAEHELGDYEAIEIRPVPIDAGALASDKEPYGKLDNSDGLLIHARSSWDDALKLGKKHGYRNAQTTVIAPTGTIGLLMDCDTTGVEPDFALVKFKKLAGGGYFKIANQSLRPALIALGYSQKQVDAIMTYVMGTGHLDVPVPGENAVTLRHWLLKAGLKEEELKCVENQLSTTMELSYAFNRYVLGEKAMERLGLSAESAAPRFNLLRTLGLTREQITQLNRLVCGSQTVEGAPELNPAHLPVFDCANTCGPEGERFIAAQGHIRMMAATQPFISGAISKTINLPNNASVDDIMAAYRLSWELGLKANALYRDGCKLSQVLNNKVDADEQEDDPENIAAAQEDVAADVAKVAAAAAAQAPVERIVEKVVERPLRRRLPDTRRSMTHKFNVAGHEGYLTVGLYDDGTPGELFITMAKEGSTIGGLMDSLGTAISVALQYGVPVESLVKKFTHQRFEPAGMTHNREIPFAKSLVDYIFRWMGMEFVGGYRAANAPERPSAKATDKAPRAEASSSGRGLVREIASRPAADHSPGDATAARGGQAAEASATKAATAKPVAMQADLHSVREVVNKAMQDMQADAPPCDVCGTIMVRNGACYKCPNCGHAGGCG